MKYATLRKNLTRNNPYYQFMQSPKTSLIRLTIIAALLTGGILLLVPYIIGIAAGLSPAFWLRLPGFFPLVISAYILLFVIALPAAIICSVRRAPLGIAALGIIGMLLLFIFAVDSPVNPRILYTARFGVSENSILVIAPYRYEGTWVFDDPRTGLFREPFVGGVPEMIDLLVKDIPDAGNGFRLTFSAAEFPGYAMKIVWRRKQGAGNWYYSPEHDMEGWICPAMFKYFRTPPKELYIKADPK